MYTRQIAVCNKTGLHARPAADFVKTAIRFKSAIEVGRTDRPGKRVNAKSLVLVLSLSAACGDLIELSAQGEDEREAVDALVKSVASGFGEEG